MRLQYNLPCFLRLWTHELSFLVSWSIPISPIKHHLILLLHLVIKAHYKILMTSFSFRLVKLLLHIALLRR